jgi:hypothetical protein
VNFLVVWMDGRNGACREVYGARVTQQGTVLDPQGFVISHSPSSQFAPAIAFDGTCFFVVWEAWGGTGGEGPIFGARVTPQGVVFDSVPILISRSTCQECCPPTVGFDGANFLVAWQDCRNDSNLDIYGARVTPQGTVLDTTGFVISHAADDRWSPAIAFDGANFLVVWNDWRDSICIYGARVTPQGTVLDPSGFAISRAPNDSCSPGVSFDGANFLVTWIDWYDHICGARVTPQGAVLDSAGIAISQTACGVNSTPVSFDGASFLVTWDDGRNGSDIYGARVTPAGVVLDSTDFVISHATNGRYWPALAFGGTNFLVAWKDGRNGDQVYADIYGARVTPGGTVPDSAGIHISQAATCEDSSAVAFDGTNFLVVWEGEGRRGDSGGIYGARVTPAGLVLDPTGFVISEAANDQQSAALAFDGTNFLVAWMDMRDGGDWDIYGARVTPQGTVLDTAGIAISRAVDVQVFPAVASDGTNSLVVWADGRDGGPEIYGARVTPQGTGLDTAGIAISRAAFWEDKYFPAVASDGTNFLVVWSDWGDSTSGNVYGARVTPQGTMLDPAGIDISRAPSMAYSQTLCFDGTNFLVVWEDHRAASDIYGARVTPQGTVLDPAGITISEAAGLHWSPSLAFDGANSLVVWEDHCVDGDTDIFGARVTPGGAVFDRGSVIGREGGQSHPRICCGSGGQMFLTYQDWTGMVGGKTYNAERVWGMMDPNPGVAESPSAQVRTSHGGATVVRGVLVLGAVESRQHAAYRAELLNIAGQKVMDLKPGANDVRALSPGVYFVLDEPNAASLKPQAVRKIVVTE